MHVIYLTHKTNIKLGHTAHSSVNGFFWSSCDGQRCDSPLLELSHTEIYSPGRPEEDQNLKYDFFIAHVCLFCTIKTQKRLKPSHWVQPALHTEDAWVASVTHSSHDYLKQENINTLLLEFMSWEVSVQPSSLTIAFISSFLSKKSVLF